MFLLAALIGAASAAVTFERAPEKDEEGVLDAPPITADRSEARTWRLKAQRRGVWASVDGVVRRHADAVDACVGAAGGGTDSTAEIELTLSRFGVATVKARGGADPVLAGCVATVLHGQQLPVTLYDGVRVEYTVGFVPGVVAVAPDGAVAPTAPVDPVVAAPAAPASEAFAPRVDEERGFGPIPWGGRSSDHEGLYASSSRGSTSFYTRQADFSARWFGAPLRALEYGFGEDGLYVVTIGVSGKTTSWQLREALTARYGAPRWDTRFGAYYWRGEHVLLQFMPTTNGEDVVITFLDIGRARVSGLADRLPGDRDDPATVDSNRRMPKIFRD